MLMYRLEMTGEPPVYVIATSAYDAIHGYAIELERPAPTSVDQIGPCAWVAVLDGQEFARIDEATDEGQEVVLTIEGDGSGDLVLEHGRGADGLHIPSELPF